MLLDESNTLCYNGSMNTNQTYFKFWENSAPEETDLACTTKGLIETLEGYIMVMGPGVAFTIQTLTEQQYKEELAKKR